MEEKKNPVSFHRIDHLANERTFLAWIRTSIGIMALGFVVERFALFLTKISYFFSKVGMAKAPHHFDQKYSSFFGVTLVAAGALIGLFSYLRFRNIQKQIEDETHHLSNTLSITLTVLVVIAGVLLVGYLLYF